jgi:hypothetical protein
MKKIAKHVATDGAEFNFKYDCRLHDQNCLLAWKVMAELAVRPVCGEFEAGDAYIQHDRNKLETIRDRLLGIFVRYLGVTGLGGGDFEAPILAYELKDGLGPRYPAYFRARLERSLPPLIFKHWARFECIDASGREWSRPSYLLSPSTTAKRLN